MAACGSAVSAEETAVILNKDGSITGRIVEEFGKNYYGEEDIREYTQKAIGVYNAKTGNDKSTSLTKVEVKDGTVYLTMEYESAADYTAFNKKLLFAGTVAEAYEAGYDLDVTLQDVSEEGSSIGKSEILQMGDHHIVIAEETVKLNLPSKALYVSDAVKLADAKNVMAGGGSGYTYVIYK